MTSSYVRRSMCSVLVTCALELVAAPAYAQATDELAPLQAADAAVVEVALSSIDEVDAAAAVADDTYAREATESAELGDATERIESAEPATPESDPSEAQAADEVLAADEPADTNEPDALAPETPASDTGSEQPTQNDTSPQEQPNEPDTPKQPDVQASSLKNTRVQAQATRAPQAAAAAYKASKAGWVVRDGKTYYYTKAGDTKPKSGWLVTNTTPAGKKSSLQRYWLGADGVLATSRLVTKAESGYWAYAKGTGEVVRGRWTDTKSGYVYLANNDGKLENTGWRVTKAYDGHLERYWVDKKAHAAIPGFSEEGYAHYTLEKGYVARSPQQIDGKLILADNDGRVCTSEGWLVSKAYDGKHLQRYYMVKTDAGYSVARVGFFEVDGNSYYGYYTKGYVLRGKKRLAGELYLADDAGKLEEKLGWLVSKTYDKNLQRYYMVEGSKGHAVAKIGAFKIEGSSYYGIPKKGYVVRGLYVSPSGAWFFADNNGKLVLTSDFVKLMAKTPQTNGIKTFGGNWTLNAAAKSTLNAALAEFSRSGQSASVVMMDLTTGLGFSVNPVTSRYSASALKAFYVTYLCETYLDTGRASRAELDSLMRRTTVDSDNDAYRTLVARYGWSGFNNWLKKGGAAPFSGAYSHTNARNVALAWAHVFRYQASNKKNSAYCRSLTDHAYFSEIHATLGSSGKTYTKPGWYPPAGNMTAYNDGGVVVKNGRPYVVVVLTNANCYGDKAKLDRLIRAVDKIHSAMPSTK